MKRQVTMYAVVLVYPNDKAICSTFNPTHDVFQPAIFSKEGDATKFIDAIESVKGFESNQYSIVEVAVLV